MEVSIFNIPFLLFLIAFTPSEKQFSFANSLFEEEDYFRAITEYKRYIFLSSDSVQIRFAQQRILSSYKRAHRFSDAFDYLDVFADSNYKNAEKGKLYLLMGKPAQARRFFSHIPSDTAAILIGWSYIEEAKWVNSEHEFSSVQENSLLYPTAIRLITYSQKAEQSIITKNLFISGFLSTVIPGAGRFYTERPGDGIFSLLTVTIPAVISYLYWKDDRKRAFSIAIGITAAFYLGDIYGSVVSAEEFNRFSRNKYTTKIDHELRMYEHFIE